MDKRFYFTLVVLLISACSQKQNVQGFITKTSTNTGLICQKDDTFQAQAIYGEDNRLDWFESPGFTKDYWAKATLALIPFHALNQKEGQYSITSLNYEKVANLCPGHRFAEQPTAAFCSAFLVSEDLVVTAGHCFRDISECQQTAFVFDYATTERNQKDFILSENSVYRCDKIIERQTGSNDFAVIRLDKKVTDRTPLNLRRQGQLFLGEQVMMIGHPMGLPSKIADGGFVQSVGEKIVASVDAFAANSGSVILNSQTGLVEGLLVAGEPDFITKEDCREEAVCGSECKGEIATPIAKVLPFIPDKNYPNPICEN